MAGVVTPHVPEGYTHVYHQYTIRVPEDRDGFADALRDEYGIGSGVYYPIDVYKRQPLKHLDGVDSLHSIVQMPAGVPVATVSIAGARNAGLLAARILGAGEGEQAEALRAKMRSFQKDLRDVASAKGAALAQRVSQAR